MLQGITPNLWFDTQAEEAAELYTSVFPNSRIVRVSHYNDAGPRQAGLVMTVEFELAGKRFVALNGGPGHEFGIAVSLIVDCETQEDIDYYTERLADGGEVGPCGWVYDRFGVAWQVVPSVIRELVGSADAGRAQRAMAAMLGMRKLEIAALQAAADGTPATSA